MGDALVVVAWDVPVRVVVRIGSELKEVWVAGKGDK